MAHPQQQELCEEIRRRMPALFRGVKVLDIGSMDVNGNNRYLFEDSEYIGCDLGEGPNVDVVCPAHEFPAEPESFDVVISTEALEHDQYLERTLLRAVEILKPGGLLLITCATDGRAEHGTKDSKPEDSPFTNDYYHNVSEQMLLDILDMDAFVQYEFRKANGEDLYFYGQKHPEVVSEMDHWDVDRYLKMYPDVAKALVTPERAFQHWLNHGIREGRVMYRKVVSRKSEFWNKGYVRLGRLFTDDEVGKLKAEILAGDKMKEQYDLAKSHLEEGGHPHNSTLYVMNDIDHIFGRACLRPGIVDTLSDFFDDDAYLYHSKVPLKYPGMIGFSWHQDYYYWHDMGCSFPAMATCFVALDPATKENGCLEVIPESHKCGRMRHILNDGTTRDSECDPKRVAVMKEKFGVDVLELEPGEVVVFHCNTLHMSGDNNSDKSRLALLGCFNTKKNSPLVELHNGGKLNHPEYSRQPRYTSLDG